MADLGFAEMQQMQRELQEQYKARWVQLAPENGKDSLLWLMVELGEAADIIKKEGAQNIMERPETRSHFVEELTDVMMYFNDALLAFHISPEELRKAYVEKHERNMSRWARK